MKRENEIKLAKIAGEMLAVIQQCDAGWVDRGWIKGGLKLLRKSWKMMSKIPSGSKNMAYRPDSANKIGDKRQYQFFQVIKDFKRMGFEIKEIAPGQFRIHDCIDIEPSRKRYYDLVNKVGGKINGKTFSRFLRDYFGITN